MKMDTLTRKRDSVAAGLWWIGAGQPLLASRMLNGVLVMVLVAAILGPVLTQRFAPQMQDEKFADQ
jgi:hypothetical protein